MLWTGTPPRAKSASPDNAPVVCPTATGVARERLLIVDALRGISILWVAVFHLWVDIRPMPGTEVGARAVAETLRGGDVASALVKAATAFAGLPSFRVDLFLFVTGLVLMMGQAQPAGVFLRRRARAILPNYWLGSLVGAAVLVALAVLRASVAGTPLAGEIAYGTRLARVAYHFEPLDILRSLLVVGRFESARMMQVIAPSLWYVALVMQAYVLFLSMRWLLERIGRAPFFLVCLAAMLCGRALVFRFNLLPTFDANATVIYFVPFRLAPLALGMVAAGWVARLRSGPGRRAALALLVPAVCLLLGAIWGSGGANRPGTLAGVIGPILPLSFALPAIWVIAAASLTVPGLGRLLLWAGRHSLSILVVQDVLRFTVGTLVAFGLGLGPYVWPLIPAYVGASLLLARAWDALQRRIADRFWPTRG